MDIISFRYLSDEVRNKLWLWHDVRDIRPNVFLFLRIDQLKTRITRSGTSIIYDLVQRLNETFQELAVIQNWKVGNFVIDDTIHYEPNEIYFMIYINNIEINNNKCRIYTDIKNEKLSIKFVRIHFKSYGTDKKIFTTPLKSNKSYILFNVEGE